MKVQIKTLLGRIAKRLSRQPKLKRIVLQVLRRFPRLEARLRGAVMGTSVMPHHVVRNHPTEVAQLSPRARQIYVDLKAEIARRRKENA